MKLVSIKVKRGLLLFSEYTRTRLRRLKLVERSNHLDLDMLGGGAGRRGPLHVCGFLSPTTIHATILLPLSSVLR
jgi:hypothetical protein